MQLELQKEGKVDLRTGGEEGDASEHICNNKQRVGTTYSLEVERMGDMSDCACDRKRGQGRHTHWRQRERVTHHIAMEITKRGQGRRTSCRCRGGHVRSWSQLQSDYRDNVQPGDGEGDLSKRNQDYKTAGMTHILEVVTGQQVRPEL